MRDLGTSRYLTWSELPNDVNDGCTTYLDLARPDSGALVTKPMPFELCGL